MNKLFFVSGLALLMSCAVCKERKAAKQAAQVTETKKEVQVAVEEEKKSSFRPATEEDMIKIEGLVRLDRPGCPVSIDMTVGDLFYTVYPVNLDKQYHKEGLKLKFSYVPSRAPSPESCTADMVVALDNIEIIK